LKAKNEVYAAAILYEVSLKTVQSSTW